MRLGENLIRLRELHFAPRTSEDTFSEVAADIFSDGRNVRNHFLKMTEYRIFPNYWVPVPCLSLNLDWLIYKQLMCLRTAE